MPTGIGPIDFIIDEDGKDIKSVSKKRLSDYLTKRTIGGEETFIPPVQGGGEYAYLPPRANTNAVPDIDNENASAQAYSEGVFAPIETTVAHFGNPDMRNAVTVVPSPNRETNNGVEENQLLTSEKTKEVIKSSILSKNRFTSDNKFSTGNFKKSMPEAPAIRTGGKNVTNGEDIYTTMRKSALVSMMNAAGGTSGPGKDGMISLEEMGDSGVVNVKNELPRIGVFPSVGNAEKIKVGELRPAGDRERYTTDSDTDINAVIVDDLRGFETDIPGANETQYNARTYGQLNSYLRQFSGIGTTSDIVLALLAFAALFIAAGVVSLIISLIIGKLPRPNPETDLLPLGAERGSTFGKFLFAGDDEASLTGALSSVGNLISKLLGVMQPYDGPFLISYFVSALEGILSIIGINTDAFPGNPLGAFASSTVNITINFGMSPGYYLLLVREIARDLALFTSDSVSQSSIIGVIAGIRELKLVRFVDTCARLGIVNQQAQNGTADTDPLAPLDPGKIIPGAPPGSPAGLVTNLFSTAQGRISRSRDTTTGKRLSWAHSSIGYTRTELVTEDLLRSFAIFPHTIGDKTVTGAGALRSLRAKKVTSRTGRIDNETRKYHENLLDAEYMPFYFHDIRTNEILSFHAFLSAISDSFTSNFNTVDGFGRMDSIQIYKNTTRAISFTFNVVATSPEDHDNMWYSINKLVNLVYPQWSEGDTISDGSTSFTQPFSQTVAASPLLRVRIGDVIHSNYSRFALSRIFGLDKTGAKIKNIDLNEENAFSPDGSYKAIFEETDKSASKTDITKTLSGPGPSKDINIPPGINVENDLTKIATANATASFTRQSVKLRPGRYKLFESYISAVDNTNGNSEKIKSDLPCKIVGYRQTRWSLRKDPFADVIVEFDNPVQLMPRFNPEKTMSYAVVQANDLTVIDDSYALNVFDLPNNIIDNTTNFMDPKNNSVVKSFEDGSGGKGLAGFITSLAIDYGSTDNTWNVERGSRAPNMAIITVSFSPIHDIPMGLGADGTSRSVAYPVGDLTRRRFMSDIVTNDNEVGNNVFSQPLKINKR
jgi:hypothetical protein